MRVKRNIDIDKQTLDWFRENFPDRSLPAFINMLLQQMREVYEKTRTPKEVSKIVARRVLRRLGK